MNLTEPMRKMLINAVAEANEHGNKHLVSLRGSTFAALIRRDLAQFTGPSPVLTNEGLEYIRDNVKIFGIEASGNASRVLMKIAEAELRAAERELIASATPIEEVPMVTPEDARNKAESVDLEADAFAVILASVLSGMTPEEVIAETGGRSPERLAELREIVGNAEIFPIEKPAPVTLPDLPEGRCGYVLHEEIQCTLDPHEGTEHSYGPTAYMDPLPFTEEKIAKWREIGAFEECVRTIREHRDEYIREHEEGLEALANGDTTLPDATERARLFRDTAREVCERFGLSGRDIVHVHDAGPEARGGAAICTKFPVSDLATSVALAVGERIAEITGEDLVGQPTATETGNVGILILPADSV